MRRTPSRAGLVWSTALLVLLASCGDSGGAATTTTTTTTPATTTTTSEPPTTTAPPVGTSTTTTTTTTATTTTTEPDPTVVVEVGYAAGEVIGGGDVDVESGTPVRIVVTSDVMEEIHVHGYDLVADVPAGGSAFVEFTADIPGIFEVELEESRIEIVELTVR